jgi:hypothetical protein
MGMEMGSPGLLSKALSPPILSGDCTNFAAIAIAGFT